jgi:hypothetical protein
MKLAAQFSFKNGLEEVNARYSHLLAEVMDAIRAIDATLARTKRWRWRCLPASLISSSSCGICGSAASQTLTSRF